MTHAPKCRPSTIGTSQRDVQPMGGSTSPSVVSTPALIAHSILTRLFDFITNIQGVRWREACPLSNFCGWSDIRPRSISALSPIRWRKRLRTACSEFSGGCCPLGCASQFQRRPWSPIPSSSFLASGGITFCFSWGARVWTRTVTLRSSRTARPLGCDFKT